MDRNTAPGLGPMLGPEGPGMLDGLRVVEIADELGEYVGLLLAGLGADVVKIEPPGGSPSRAIGPFLDDRPDPEASLHFWHFNRGKRSVVCDLDTPEDRSTARRLIASADILLDTTSDLERHADLSRAALSQRDPGLILARMSPFGDTGPWADWKGSDLIHLALGGVMMNCGYDPDPALNYDLPPIAPQLWHAYHIAGDQLAVGILAALLHRNRTGEGQEVALAVHEAVSKNTELDLMSWVMLHKPLWRMTCRHAADTPGHTPTIAHTKDGRWLMAYGLGAKDRAGLGPFLDRYAMAGDLPVQEAPVDAETERNARSIPGSGAAASDEAHRAAIVQTFVRAFSYDNLPWREAQEAGLLWSPLRKPHESAEDDHWLQRTSFRDIDHPALGRSLRYAVSKWLSTETSWQTGHPAPKVGADQAQVLADWIPTPLRLSARASAPVTISPHGKPFALQGIRILDFSWFLASAGGTRFLAALGAESLKIEWKDNPDTRMAAMAPVGGRAARQAATGPLQGVTDPSMGGQFNNKNAGKRGLSLNIRDPRGLAICKELLAQCDIVAEGFSPGVLDRLGLGYDVMRQIKPDIIYIQQSGMGSHGTYGRFRTVGPVAAAFSGTSEMSGLPEPAMPAGWGYSYLDWAGAYGYALAILGALNYRDRTGKGQWIDSSQCESGLFMTGVQALDWSANRRAWSRIGNRSPYKPAAPHGAFRCAGRDRWIAIACFAQAEWEALAGVAQRPDWLRDSRFATLPDRLANQDALEREITAWTTTREPFELMQSLQSAQVPAGVCQTAADRCDTDPQLAALNWLTEVTGTKIGTWPVIELPAKLSATPAHAGGPFDRGAPGYGEDNLSILSEFLGLTEAEVQQLVADGVI